MNFREIAGWNSFFAKVEAAKQDSFEYFLIDGPVFIAWGKKKGLW